MWELLFRGVEVAVVLGGVFSSVYASKLWLQAQKHQSISEAKDELVKVTMNDREGWKSRYELEHQEFLDHREKAHAANNETNARILGLTDENAALKAKTDLSPVNLALQSIQKQGDAKTKLIQDFITEQTLINGKILAALVNLEARINGRKQRAGSRAAN